MSGAQLAPPRNPIASSFSAGSVEFVGGERRQERNRGEPGLTILLDQVHAHAAGHEGEDRFRLVGGDLGEFGGEIELAEGRVDLIDNLALEVALEAGEGVFARLVVRRQQEGGLVALVLRIFAEDLVNLIVLI